MLKNKKLLFLVLATIIELILIVVFLILYLTAKSNTPDYSDDSDGTTLYEYCQLYDDEELCENEDEYYDQEAYNDSDFYVDPEMYSDEFLNTYADILNGVPISHDRFTNFIILSEYYSDEYYKTPISGENEPTTYHASIRDTKTDLYLYPYNLVRNISIDIPNEGCAVFDFSVDFSFLKNYTLMEEGCNEIN